MAQTPTAHDHAAPEATAAPSTGRKAVAALGMLAAVAAVATLGVLSNAPHTDGWYAEVERVPWSPPNWLFGPAWTILYVLIAVSGSCSGVAGSGDPGGARRRGAS